MCLRRRVRERRVVRIYRNESRARIRPRSRDVGWIELDYRERPESEQPRCRRVDKRLMSLARDLHRRRPHPSPTLGDPVRRERLSEIS
jgi:hypothetical protein